MSFLKKSSAQEQTLTLKVQADAETAKGLANNLSTIVKNLSPEQIRLVAEATKNKILINTAMGELKKYVK